MLDLTDLGDTCTATQVDALCRDARAGGVAAVCVWPQFVHQAARVLAGGPVRIATVINFPAGGEDVDRAVDDTAEALRDGAHEIDLVLPYGALLRGDAETARLMVEAVREACPKSGLKVILETGELRTADAIAAASRLSLAAGADFIKTSTGKTGTSATPPAARTMLEAIKAAGKPVGLKPSGGLRTLADARIYLDLADEIMGPDWATAKTFRFGASGLYGVLADIIAGTAPAERTDGAY
ncbi:MAG: deoxyribose-phosphate aldolase [Hyphomicrobiales bacterium]|nr:MAG: deoxyribose-phosphate aldolase [Hyphomicrobiales bacterium]